MKIKYVLAGIVILSTVLFCIASVENVGMFISIIGRITAMIVIGVIFYAANFDN